MSALWCAYPRSCSSFRGGKVAKRLLERLEARNRFVMSEVEMQRGDGDESTLDRFEVRPFTGMPRGRFSADPVVTPSPRVLPLDHTLRVDAPPQLRDLHAGKLTDGEIDIQH